MIDFLKLLACVLTRLFRSRARLEAEVLVLRHQLNILQRKSTKRAAFKSIDRLVFGYKPAHSSVIEIRPANHMNPVGGYHSGCPTTPAAR
jgi:predicted RNase H-like nuclease